MHVTLPVSILKDELNLRMEIIKESRKIISLSPYSLNYQQPYLIIQHILKIFKRKSIMFSSFIAAIHKQ